MNLPPINVNVWAQRQDGEWFYCYYHNIYGWMIGVDGNPVDAPLGFDPVQWLMEEDYVKLPK